MHLFVWSCKCHNIAKTQFSILNFPIQIEKEKHNSIAFCEDYESPTYFGFSKTGEKLSLIKVYLFFASSICAKDMLIN